LKKVSKNLFFQTYRPRDGGDNDEAATVDKENAGAGGQQQQAINRTTEKETTTNPQQQRAKSILTSRRHPLRLTNPYAYQHPRLVWALLESDDVRSIFCLHKFFK
jgi:hypothetical protein